MKNWCQFCYRYKHFLKDELKISIPVNLRSKIMKNLKVQTRKVSPEDDVDDHETKHEKNTWTSYVCIYSIAIKRIFFSWGGGGWNLKFNIFLNLRYTYVLKRWDRYTSLSEFEKTKWWNDVKLLYRHTYFF